MTPEMISEVRAREERKHFTTQTAMNVLDTILRFELSKCEDGMNKYPDPEILAASAYNIAEAMAAERESRNLNPQV